MNKRATPCLISDLLRNKHPVFREGDQKLVEKSLAKIALVGRLQANRLALINTTRIRNYFKIFFAVFVEFVFILSQTPTSNYHSDVFLLQMEDLNDSRICVPSLVRPYNTRVC